MPEQIPGDGAVPPLAFHYRNHRGELATRHVVPDREKPLWFGSTEWHQEPQWLLRGYDLYRQAVRDYALNDVAFGDPKRIPRFNPNLRRSFVTIALGILVVVLVLLGVLTVLKSYQPSIGVFLP